jgi:hypothetical protein
MLFDVTLYFITILHMFLEPNKCFTLKMGSGVCDSDICGGFIGPRTTLELTFPLMHSLT